MAEQSIVERVAEAMVNSDAKVFGAIPWDALAEPHRKICRARARAAIAAMREPTTAMMDAAWDMSCDEYFAVEASWKAAIDAALKEG